MAPEMNIIRAVDRISSYIQRCVQLVAPERHEEVVELFDSMRMLFPHWGIMACPAMHPELPYISQNMPTILGHDKDLLESNTTIERLFRFVHPNDQSDLHKSIMYLHEFIESVAPDDHQNYRSVLHYRFRRSDGEYIYLHDEKATLNLHGQGNFYYGLYHNLDKEKKFNGVCLEIFEHKNGMKKIAEYKPSSFANTLSKRERELVSLIKQGLSTKEIAWELHISHHTVRNIKSKLFEKYNVNSSIELLNATG